MEISHDIYHLEISHDFSHLEISHDFSHLEISHDFYHLEEISHDFHHLEISHHDFVSLLKLITIHNGTNKCLIPHKRAFQVIELIILISCSLYSILQKVSFSQKIIYPGTRFLLQWLNHGLVLVYQYAQAMHEYFSSRFVG